MAPKLISARHSEPQTDALAFLAAVAVDHTSPNLILNADHPFHPPPKHFHVTIT